MPTAERIRLGILGENLACRELERQGYEILARRYRTRYGEIDIVARDGATVVFVEVKARTSRRFGEGSDAVNGVKREKITAMAVDYVARQHGREVPLRFDVIVVELKPGSEPMIEHYKSAFDAALWC